MSEKNNNFNLIRFFLSSLVVFAHCFPLADGSTAKLPYGDTTREWLYYISGEQLFGGSLAVYLFFILSGFLIAQSFMHSSSLKSYFIKRVLRIYPAFIFTALIGSLLISPLSIGFAKFYHFFSFSDFLTSIFFLQQPDIPKVFLNNPYAGEQNGSLWTIKYEAAMYILTALLGVVGVFRRKATALFMFVIFYMLYLIKIFWPFLIWKFDRSLYPFGRMTEYPAFLTYFFAGVVTSLFIKKIVFRPKYALLCAGVLFLGLFGYLEALLPIFGTYLIIYFGKESFNFLRFTKTQDLSYGVYLNSFLIQQSLLHFFPQIFRRSPYWLFFACYPLTLIAAYASWNIIEKRFLELKGRLR